MHVGIPARFRVQQGLGSAGIGTTKLSGYDGHEIRNPSGSTVSMGQVLQKKAS